MKDVFCKAVALSMLAVPAVFAQDTSKNVNSLTAKELATVPVIDGDLSDAAWQDITEIVVDGSGDDAAPTVAGDLDVTMKVAWDDETNALYFGFTVVDDVFINVLARGASSGDGGWNNERMEMIINGANTGSASDGEGSAFHTQYTFDIPSSFDPQPEGIFDLPVSTSFVSVPVYEGIDGSIQAPGLPFDFNDDFVESAARIRVTDPAAVEWLESPVEWTLEVKIQVFDEMFSTGELSYDVNDAANIADGFRSFFTDSVNVLRDLEANDVIGISPQQNDSDVFAGSPQREHQVNTTDRAGNWNDSSLLTGLILAPKESSVKDWELK